MDAALGYLELEADEEVYLRLNMRGQCLARHMVMATNANDVDRIVKLADVLLAQGAGLAAPAAELQKNVLLWSRLKTNAQRQKHALRMFAESDGVRVKAVNTLLTACIAALQTLPSEAFSPVRPAAPPPPPAAAARDTQAAAAPEAAAKGKKPAAATHKPAPGGGVRIGRPAQRVTLDDDDDDDEPVGNGGAPPQRHQAKATTLPWEQRPAGGAPQQRAARLVLPPRKRAKPIVEEPGSEEKAGPSSTAPKNMAARDPDIDNACDVCGSYEMGTGKDVMLVCDGWNCAGGRHLGCCSPALDQPPPGDWFCDTCAKWRADGVPAAALSEIYKKYGTAAPVWRAMLWAFGEKTGSHNAEWLESRLKRGGLGAASAPRGSSHAQQPARRNGGAGPASFKVADVSYEGTEEEDGEDDDAMMATLEPEVEVADAEAEDVEPAVDDLDGDYDKDDDFEPPGKAAAAKGHAQAKKGRQGTAQRKLVLPRQARKKAAPPPIVVPKGPPAPTVRQVTPGKVPKLAYQMSLEFPDDDDEADAEVDDVHAEEAGGRGTTRWSVEELVALGEGVRAHGTNWVAILQGSALLRRNQRKPAQLAEKYKSLEPGNAAAGPSGKQAAKKSVVRKRIFEEEAAPAQEAKRQKTEIERTEFFEKQEPPPPPPVAKQVPRKTRATEAEKLAEKPRPAAKKAAKRVQPKRGNTKAKTRARK